MGENKNKNRKIDRNRKSGQNAAYKGEKRHIKSHIKRLTAAIISSKLPDDHPEMRRLNNHLRRYEAMK